MTKFSGRKILTSVCKAVVATLFNELTMLLGLMALVLGGMVGGCWYETEYKPRREKEAEIARQKEYEIRYEADAQRAVDDFVREYAQWASLPEAQKSDTKAPEPPKFNRRAKDILEQRMYIAKNGLDLPVLDNEPTPTREEYARRLAAYKEKHRWIGQHEVYPESYAYLAIDRAERRWLSEMENRLKQAIVGEFHEKIKQSGQLDGEILVVEITDFIGPIQVGYHFGGGSYEQYNNALREILNAGPNQRRYEGGIWMPANKEKSTWFSIYNCKKEANATSGNPPIVDLGDCHVVAVRLGKDTAKVVFNTPAPAFRLEKMEKAVLALAQKAGLDVNSVETDLQAGAHAHNFKLSKK